jgi:hypothetical protein
MRSIPVRPATTPNGAARVFWFEKGCVAAVVVVPFLVALVHLASASVWRDDLPLLRGLAWVGSGRSGGLGAMLVQASFFVPLGSVHFRAGLCFAAVLAASSFVIFRVTRVVLERAAHTPRLSVALAAISALMATLCATGQREGTVAGGGCLALLVSMLIVLVAPAQSLMKPAPALAAGLLFGALAGESAAVALPLFAGVCLALLLARERPARGAMTWALGGALASMAFVSAPLYLRPLSHNPFLDLGHAAGAFGFTPFEAPAPRLGGVTALGDDVGRMALLLALAGGLIGVARPRLRAVTAPLVAVVVLDVVASLREGSLFSSEQLAPLHLVALSFLSVGIALAVQLLAVTLLNLGLVFARETTLLLVMGDLALMAASAEDASFSADRSVARGAEAFTDEAVERLSPSALLLLRSRPAAHRFWCARAADGLRPDLLIAPVPILGDTRLALGLLRAEPAFHQSLRDASLEGRPGEEALTMLADARPVLVELDPRWDRRIMSHLAPDHLWLRFAPEPLGTSDRKTVFADLRLRFDRVLAASSVDERTDLSTTAMLRARLTDGAALAAALGDRAEAILLLEQLGKVSSGDRFVAELTQRLAATKSGAIDLTGLLR